MAGKFTALPATPEMHKLGFSFADVEAYAQKSIDLVNATGTQFVGLLNDGFRLYQGVTGKDFGAIFSALNDANADGKKIVDAITGIFFS